MRITFILPNFAPKPVGGFRIVYEYANRLVERGHEVSLVYPMMVKGLTPQTIYNRTRTRLGHLYRSLFKPEPAWHHIDQRVKTFFVPAPTPNYISDGDMVFATVWALVDYLTDYPKSKGEKAYFIQHYETWSGPVDLVDKSWQAPVHKVVISKWLYDIGKSLGIDNMTIVPNGLDYSVFRLTSPIEPRTPSISMMYSEIHWKGASDGIRALEVAKGKFPGIKATFFGIGQRGSNIPEWIEYVQNPSQEVLVGIYNNSSIFVCPSHVEGFALPPAEAMSCGAAVVTTDCGGVRDFVEDGSSALISQPKDPDALARNLCKLLDDDSLRINIAITGYNDIQKFTWERSIQLMEDFIKSVTGKG